jgi:hypothetical protein
VSLGVPGAGDTSVAVPLPLAAGWPRRAAREASNVWPGAVACRRENV